MQKLQQITLLSKLETPLKTTLMLTGCGLMTRPLKEEGRKHHSGLQSDGFHRGRFTIGFKKGSSCTNVAPTLHIGTKNRLGL